MDLDRETLFRRWWHEVARDLPELVLGHSEGMQGVLVPCPEMLEVGLFRHIEHVKHMRGIRPHKEAAQLASRLDGVRLEVEDHRVRWSPRTGHPAKLAANEDEEE